MSECTRHSWEVEREKLMDFPAPNGSSSGELRMYQLLRCRKCTAKTSRWKKTPKRKVT